MTLLLERQDDEYRADDQAERLRHAYPAGHRGPLAHRHVIGHRGTQAGVLAVLERAEQDPEQRHSGHSPLMRKDQHANRAEQGHR